MLDLDVVYDKLEQFESADEIAAFLIQEQVKATPQNGVQCALAMWVKQVTETELNIHVSSKKTIVYKEDHDVYDVYKNPAAMKKAETKAVLWQRDHTTAMEQFIHRFDEGAYPDLITKNWFATKQDSVLKFKQEIYTGQMYAQPHASYHSSSYADGGYSVMLQVKASTTSKSGITTITSLSVA